MAVTPPLFPFYFAWVLPTETTFDPDVHSRYDEDVFSFVVQQGEGDFASLKVTIKNPRIGLLTAARKSWAWLAYDPNQVGDPGVPLFFGRLVGIPSDINQEIVELVFTARPIDFVTRKQTKAETLKVAPYWDELFINPDELDNPEMVLEARSALWSVDRITHEVDISDIIAGEDGLEEFLDTEVPYQSVQIQIGSPPLNKVTMDATVKWNQAGTGGFQFKINTHTYNGSGLLENWPKPGTSIGGGWTVVGSSIFDNFEVDKVESASYQTQWQNKEKEHNNGDTMSVSASLTIPLLKGPAVEIITGGHSQPGFLDPFSDPPLNIASETSLNKTYVPQWWIVGQMSVDYEAAIPREEHLKFTMLTDIQQLITKLTDDEEAEIGYAELKLNSIDVDVPTRATASATGTLTLTGTPVAGQTVNIGGFNYVWVVNPATLPTGMRVKIGANAAASLDNLVAAINGADGVGTLYGYNTPPNSLVTASHLAGSVMTVTAKEAGIAGNQIATTETMTNGSWGASKLSGGLGGEIPIGNVSNRVFFTTARGLLAVAYLIQRARATLLASERPVQISFEVPFERALDLTIRKNAKLNDPRIPGGSAIGKIINYSFAVDGSSGIATGSLQMACTIGYGVSTLDVADGVPVYVSTGYVAPGYQQYAGKKVAAGTGDISYGLPFDSGIGPTLPFSRRDVVVKEILHGDDLPFSIDVPAPITIIQSTTDAQKVQSDLIQAAIDAELAANETWFELELKPVTLDVQIQNFIIPLTRLSIPKQIDLESNIQL
jgi:hypothetical protein